MTTILSILGLAGAFGAFFLGKRLGTKSTLLKWNTEKLALEKEYSDALESWDKERSRISEAYEKVVENLDVDNLDADTISKLLSSWEPPTKNS